MEDPRDDRPRPRHRHRLLTPTSIDLGDSRPVVAVRGLIFLGLLVWTWPLSSRFGAALESFLHGVNLVFHEAGHILLIPFGQFLTSLGGSLTQLVVPLVCLVALARHGDRFGASVALWWTGENLLDLAPYIADARALQLMLLGGVTGREVEGHDWEAILRALGWLEYDRLLGQTAHGLGVAVMIGALVWGARQIRAGWSAHGAAGR